MATPADLFASSQAPNPNQLRTQPVAYQRPKGFINTIGKIADAMAALGGDTPYRDAIARQEQAYNQSMEKQQFQNVFRNFVENPNDPLVQANLAEVNPDAFLKVAPQNRALGNRVVRMGPLGTPEVVVEAPVEPVAAPKMAPGFLGLLQARRGMFPEGSPEANMLDQRINAEIQQKQRLAEGPAPRAAASGGGGNAGPQFLTPEQKTAYGLDPDLPWIIDNKGNPRLPTGFKPPTGQRGAVAPEEVLSTIQRARTLLPAASPGGLAGAATRAGEFVGMSTDRSKADAALRVIAGKLTASVPRFEGPQALPEVKLYQAMAADVANSDLPVQSRLAALSEMEALVKRNQQVKAQRRPGAAPAQGGGKTIRFDAQGRRIP